MHPTLKNQTNTNLHHFTKIDFPKLIIFQYIFWNTICFSQATHPKPTNPQTQNNPNSQIPKLKIPKFNNMKPQTLHIPKLKHPQQSFWFVKFSCGMDDAFFSAAGDCKQTEPADAAAAVAAPDIAVQVDPANVAPDIQPADVAPDIQPADVAPDIQPADVEPPNVPCPPTPDLAAPMGPIHWAQVDQAFQWEPDIPVQVDQDAYKNAPSKKKSQAARRAFDLYIVENRATLKVQAKARVQQDKAAGKRVKKSVDSWIKWYAKGEFKALQPEEKDSFRRLAIATIDDEPKVRGQDGTFQRPVSIRKKPNATK